MLEEPLIPPRQSSSGGNSSASSSGRPGNNGGITVTSQHVAYSGLNSYPVAVMIEEEEEDEEQLPRSRRVSMASVQQEGGEVPDTFNICAFNLSKVILGAGMMAMPKAMYLLGAVPGTVLMIVIGLLTYYTLAQGLISSSDAIKAKTYGRLVNHTLGSKAEGVLQLSVFVTCWVIQVVFLVVIGDILIGDPPEHHGLIRELTGLTGGLATSRPLILGLVCAAVLMPLGNMRTMERLAAVNVIGVAANAVFAALMVALAFATYGCGQARAPPLWPDWERLVACRGGVVGAALCLASTVPVILNCFACHQSLHPLLPSLRPYTTARAQSMVATSLGMAGVLYYTIALCACAVFGDTLHDDVLTDISATRMAPILNSELLAHASALTVRVGYLLSLLGSFLLLLFPLRHVLAEVVLGGHDALQGRWLPVTAVLTLSVYLTACFLPSIWDALSLVGATATTMQAWIIPSLIILSSEWRRPRLRRDAGAEEGRDGCGGGGAGGGPGAGAGAGGRGAWARAGRLALSGFIFGVGVVMFLYAIVDSILKHIMPQ